MLDWIYSHLGWNGWGKVRVVYKSGAVITCKVKNLVARRNGEGDLVRVTYDRILPGAYQLGINEIAAIWVA